SRAGLWHAGWLTTELVAPVITRYVEIAVGLAALLVMDSCVVSLAADFSQVPRSTILDIPKSSRHPTITARRMSVIPPASAFVYFTDGAMTCGCFQSVTMNLCEVRSAQLVAILIADRAFEE